MRRSKSGRSGFEFNVREKAYHVYMYTLQKRNYGTKVSEYVKSHNLNNQTFQGWMRRYPGGSPYFDPNSDITSLDVPHGENQLVKLAPSQLQEPVVETIQHPQFNPGIIAVKYCGAEICADKDSILSVILAIKSVNGLTQ